MKKLLNKKEIIILVCIIAMCGLFLLGLRLTRTESVHASVYYRGEKIKTVSLGKDEIITIDANLLVTLAVEDGTIRFVNSQCPDKICEGFGRLSQAYEYAICAPAGITVIIEN